MPVPPDDAQTRARIDAAFRERFGETVPVPQGLGGLDTIATLAARRVHRSYSDAPVAADLLRLLCAAALSAPSKSDLQQRDIIVINDPALRTRIADLLPHMPWVRAAPRFIVFCANGARVRHVSALRVKPFPNNHLDLFFNAVGDAAIALATCVQAAEAMGLGVCPISEIRNHAATIDGWLELPPQVIPFAGLCIGWPGTAATISPRLPMQLTVHEDRYTQPPLDPVLRDYDARREALQPYDKQYQPERWGTVPAYGWSEQKARQYAVQQRADFADYVRAKGFVLE
jgi:nitroreductase/FMN reductase [NAD(P)H]